MGKLNIPNFDDAEWIGSGNCGEVFRGSLADGTPVAIKKLHAMGLDRDRVSRNSRRSLKAPAHPGVVALLSSGIDSSPYHLVMEWHGTGKPITGLQGALPEEQAWPFIISLADAMAHLHRHGIHHGNLHPGNVIAEPGQKVRARVTDYGPGLAGRVHHLDIGETAWFAHPGQLEDPANWEDGAVERWDVYRFGAVAYWLIHGRAPRGEGYRAARDEQIESGGGRPVPVDIAALAEDMRGGLEIPWDQPAASPGVARLREIIGQCLSFESDRQFHDMREVCRAFEALDRQMAMEDAEARVTAAQADADLREARERASQLSRLRRTRLIAACLAGGLLTISALLVRYLQRSFTFEGRLSELGVVIDHQENRIEALDREKSQTAHELRHAREAADAVFAHMGKPGTVSEGVPAEGSIERENLEKSKSFVVQNLRQEPKTLAERLEHARNLQHLAHLETRLGDRAEALKHLAEAVAGFEKTLAGQSGEIGAAQDTQARLADCHEAMAGLIPRDPGQEMLTSLSEASRYLGLIAARRSEDRQIALRQIAVDSRLGRQFQAHRDHAKALEIYAALADRLGAWIKKEPGTLAPLELLAEIQFQSAAILRDTGRPTESADAYAAAMESLTQLTGDRPPGDDHTIRLGRIYADLGDLFSNRAPDAELYQLYNEANRLLGPVHDRRPDHLETAVWLSRARSQLGRIDRDASRWSDGYKVSLSAVEVLEGAMTLAPDDLEARLTLIEVRASHAEMLQYQKAIAKKCLGKGFDLAETTRQQLDDDVSMPAGARKNWQLRLAGLYERYGKLSRKLGDIERAEICDDRAIRARELLVGNETIETAVVEKKEPFEARANWPMPHVTGFRFALALVLLSPARAQDPPDSYPRREAVEFNGRAGLPNVLPKMRAGGEIRVAYLGGSITAAPGWRVKSLAWLRSRYPKSTISEINAAIGGTGSDLGVFRHGQDALRHRPDLLFVEFAVNDSGTKPERIHQAMEGIVRQTWAANPATDIVFVYTLNQPAFDELKSGKFSRSASAMEEIADHYHIPSIHFGLEVVSLEKAGKLIYQAEKNEDPGGRMVFSTDGVHPLVETGHQLYQQALQRSWEKIEALPQARPSVPRALAAPMREDHWQDAKLVPITAAMLTGSWKKLDPGTDEIAKRFERLMPAIWRVSEPGAALSFRFKGTVAGIYDLLGPDGGQVRVKLDDQPERLVPRFDPFCTYHRLAKLDLGNGLDASATHRATIALDPRGPDKLKTLFERNRPDMEKNPEKYAANQWHAGAIMLIGELAD